MRRLLVAAALAAGCALPLCAQQRAVRPEIRADLLGAAPYAAQLGAGLNTNLGYYARLEVDAGGGALREHDALVGTGRVDALARLLLDPFGESHWGLSLGGGVSARYRAGDRVRPYLAVVADLEGPKVGGQRVALQAGVGGGVRVGVVVRGADVLWR